jgi:hypothetical protein
LKQLEPNRWTVFPSRSDLPEAALDDPLDLS